MSAQLEPVRRVRRSLSLCVVLVAASVGAACGGGGGGGDGPTGTGNPVNPVDNNPVATQLVVLRNSSFTPPSILVSPGATVTFSNQDGISHNVNFNSTAVHGVSDFSAGSVDVTMPTAPGTYSYFCSLHGGMNGSIKVQ